MEPCLARHWILHHRKPPPEPLKPPLHQLRGSPAAAAGDGLAERPALLARLSRACPPAEREAATRLLLKALAESDDGKGIKADAALRSQVQKLLADPAASRAQMDVVVNVAPDITKALAPQPGADRQSVPQ
jgi:hypothetical protein